MVKLDKWLKVAGIDEVAQDTPRNFFQENTEIKPAEQQSAKPANKVAQSQAFVQPTISHASLSSAIEEARSLADNAKTLEDLRKAVEGFNGCALKKTANKTVFADGNPKAGVMLIGEAPGADEDVQGIPFCGQSGQLLDKVLWSIKLDRKDGFYITNTLFWRPPGNRKPTPEELAICKPFLEKHIALVNPKILLLVGATAVQGVLEDDSSMTKLRGKTFKYKNQYMEKEVTVAVTYHPSYLLRSPLNKCLAWEDMLFLKETISKL